MSISADSERIPVLLDTDIGSDIDDAVALAYLLRQPRCELVGITTVSGDTAKRAACADVVCRAAGRSDVPIHCGAPGPLLWGSGQPRAPHYEAIQDRPHRKDWPVASAVEFMRRTIRERPGEITLLSIGPFTNVAILFALDPEIPSLLGDMVSMAGVFFRERPTFEWNCMVDPVSTAIAYAQAPEGHLSVGLDVTLECRMHADEVRNRFRVAPLDVVSEMAEVWFERAEHITFHDPLAATLLFNDELCEYREGKVDVAVSKSPRDRARVRLNHEGQSTAHTVAATVNVDAFFQEYFSVFAS